MTYFLLLKISSDLVRDTIIITISVFSGWILAHWQIYRNGELLFKKSSPINKIRKTNQIDTSKPDLSKNCQINKYQLINSLFMSVPFTLILGFFIMIPSLIGEQFNKTFEYMIFLDKYTFQIMIILYLISFIILMFTFKKSNKYCFLEYTEEEFKLKKII